MGSAGERLKELIEGSASVMIDEIRAFAKDNLWISHMLNQAFEPRDNGEKPAILMG